MALVIDTGVAYAALYEEDPDHERCLALFQDASEPLIIPSAVLVELDYWLIRMAGMEAWTAFCADIETGAYELYPVDREILAMSARIEAQYGDLGLGIVDASVFATCELLGETKVATLDRRHFSVLRTREGKALHIVPE